MIEYAFVFIFGLLIGSFLNCVIYRLEQGKSFLKGRSYCPYCKHQLAWHDLLPVLSFILLKGKCRYCGKAISLQYPLVELATGILFVLIFWLLPVCPAGRGFQWSSVIACLSGRQGAWDFFNLCFLFFVSCLLTIIFVYDLKHYIIPDRVIYLLIGMTFLYRLFDIGHLGNFFLSGLIASAFFLFIVFISRGKAMGMGDIKLAFFMGLFLGFPAILTALFFGFMIGAIIGIGLVIKGKKTLKSQVPFGPFLVIGTLIAFFWGEKIINWYLNFLLL